MSDPAVPRSDADELDALRGLAVEVGREAGALLLDGLRRHRTSVTTKSTATDLVTEMDRASEQLVVASIRRHRPDDGIVGEEGADHPGTSGLRWVIDPLDGTTNYVYGLPGFGVSIAVEDERGALAAAVVDPVHDEVFSAARGRGATRDGEPIRCSEAADLARALVATGFGYDARRRAVQAQVLVDVLPAVRDIRRVGAAAVDLCSVACGRVDAFFERGLAHWDHAAGALIAAEAGASVGDLHGGSALSAFVVAAPPALFEPLRELLLAAGADRDDGTGGA